MSRYKNGAVDAPSALSKNTTDTFFRSLGYYNITTIAFKEARYKQDNDTPDAYATLYNLLRTSLTKTRGIGVTLCTMMFSVSKRLV